MDRNLLIEEIEHQVRRSRVLTVILAVVAVLNASLVALLAGGTDAKWTGTVIALGVLGLWLTGAYFYYARIVLRATGARPPTAAERARLEPMIGRLAASMNLPMPHIMVMDDDAANAFAVGSRPEQATVTFSTGLLKLLNDDELEGVAAHELSHIAHGDTRKALYTAGLLGWAVVISTIVSFLVFGVIAAGAAMVKGDDRDGDTEEKLASLFFGLFLIAGAAVAWIAGQIWVLVSRITDLAISRQREWLADASAARVTGKPLALAQALEKLNNANVTLTQGRRIAQALCIAGLPRARSWWRDLFSTHPDLEARIRRLYQYVGLASDRR